ncbi:hypothetical protein [Vallitalea longa]|nr:hypothetical protein [Vallitalea longa]
MTSYNPINGVWAASNYDLNTTPYEDVNGDMELVRKRVQLWK